jgi:uncharacterized protein (TIGR00730 family)
MSQRSIARLCVFCGSSRGSRPEYLEAAGDFGRMLAGEGIALVYGGGSVGLMGVLADAMLAAGGHVIGVIPHSLQLKEVGHRNLTELHVVDTMHERKAQMADLADAFVALPGGLGTFEEIFEIITWAILGIHAKPCGFLNVEGYYDELIRFLDSSHAAGFIRSQHRHMIHVENDSRRLLSLFRGYEPPAIEKWIRRDET